MADLSPEDLADLDLIEAAAEGRIRRAGADLAVDGVVVSLAARERLLNLVYDGWLYWPDYRNVLAPTRRAGALR